MRYLVKQVNENNDLKALLRFNSYDLAYKHYLMLITFRSEFKTSLYDKNRLIKGQ